MSKIKSTEAREREALRREQAKARCVDRRKARRNKRTSYALAFSL